MRLAIKVLSDNGGAEARNARARGVCIFSDVHEYVFLTGRQCGQSRFETITYRLEASMNHLARVEVVEALRNIEQLVTGVSTGSSK